MALCCEHALHARAVDKQLSLWYGGEEAHKEGRSDAVTDDRSTKNRAGSQLALTEARVRALELVCTALAEIVLEDAAASAINYPDAYAKALKDFLSTSQAMAPRSGDSERREATHK